MKITAHIRNDRSGPGDKRLDSRRRRRPRDDMLNGLDRVVARGENDQNIRGLTVGALRGLPGEFITPEVLNVCHMLRIVFQLRNQAIVISVGIVAEGLLTL
jgi:hypothetical protein